MPLKTAFNPDTKETMVLQGDAWVKADQVAKNEQGVSAYLVGGKWLQDEVAPKPGATNRTGAKATVAPEALKEEPGIWDRFKRLAFSSPESVVAERPDASPGAVANAGSDVAGGLTSAATAPVGALAGGMNLMHGVMQGDNASTLMDQFHAGQQAFTYQPRTPGAQSVADAAGTVLGAPGAALHYAGEKVFDATGSPALAAGLETAGNAALMIAPGLRARAKAAPAAAPASARLTVAPLPTFAPEVTARAEAFAKKAGIDWGSAGEKFKENLTKIATDAAALDRLDPKAAARVARAEKIGAPITRGQATRDLLQITDEENIKRTKAGESIRKKSAQQDTALHDRLTSIREGVAPKVGAIDASDSGGAVQGAARRKVQVLTAEAGRLYREAEAAGEMLKPVNAAPLNAFLKEPVNKRNIGWLEQAIKDYGQGEGKPLTLKNMEDLRAEVAAAAGESGRKGFVGGKALRVIDDILDSVDSQVYAKARGKWREMKEETAQQGAIRDLTSEKAGTTDRRIALEDTLGRIVRGSNEGLTQIKNTLTRGGTAQTRARGAQAWKKLQAGVIEHMREAAAGKRKIEGEDSQLQFNSAFLDELTKLEHGGKLETLFGKAAANQIRELGTAVRDLRTTPTDRVVGPQTALRVFRMMEKLSSIPGVEKIATLLRERAAIKQAGRNPVSQAAEAVKPAKLRKPPSPIKRAGAAAAVLAPQTYQGDGR